MSTPAIIIIILQAVSCTVALMKHGEEVKLNFFGTLFIAGINMAILSWGGFF